MICRLAIAFLTPALIVASYYLWQHGYARGRMDEAANVPVPEGERQWFKTFFNAIFK